MDNAGQPLSGPSPKANSMWKTRPGPTHGPFPNSWALERRAPDGPWPSSPVPIRWDRWVTGHREPAGQGPSSAAREEGLRASHAQPPVRPGDAGGPRMLAHSWAFCTTSSVLPGSQKGRPCMSQHASVGHKLVLSRAYPAGWDHVLVGVWVLQEHPRVVTQSCLTLATPWTVGGDP